MTHAWQLSQGLQICDLQQRLLPMHCNSWQHIALDVALGLAFLHSKGLLHMVRSLCSCVLSRRFGSCNRSPAESSRGQLVAAAQLLGQGKLEQLGLGRKAVGLSSS